MQGNRNGGLPTRLPDPDSLEYRAQKVVLLELVVTPPAEGDRIDELIDRLCVPGDAIVPAIAALVVGNDDGASTVSLWTMGGGTGRRVQGARTRQIARVEHQVDDRVVGGVPHLFAAMVASPACGDSMRRVVVTLGCSRRR